MGEMNYKAEYEKTVEQLFFAVRELDETKRLEEVNYTILCLLSSVISALWDSLDKIPMQRKTSAEITLQRLIKVFMHLGKFYMDELKWRKDLFYANKALLEASAIIEGLKLEIEKINEINNF
jgi:hypothetical protein